MSLYEVDQRLTALQSQVNDLKSIIQLDTRVTPDGTELIPISLPSGAEYKMSAETFFKSRGKAEAADYSLVATDKNSIIDMTGNSATFTIPNDLSWQNFSSCFLIQSGTGLTVASGGSVTVNSPQTLGTVQHSIYVIFKTATNEFTIVQIGTASGGGGAVDSVFGRTGDVVANSGDYTAAQVTNAFDKTADDTDNINEGSTNLYYTEARVTANTSVAANTAKVTNLVPTSSTGTVLSLTNNEGILYNMSSANTATTYTTTGTTLNAYARVLINAATEPAITGATKIAGSAFAASTNMYMTAWYNGTAVQFWFEEI